MTLTPTNEGPTPRPSAIDVAILGEDRRNTLRDLAADQHLSIDQVDTFWRTLGLPHSDPDDEFFTDHDAEALERLYELVSSGAITETTALTLTRALGHMGDRIALWQVEAVAEEILRRRDMSEGEVRLAALKRLAEISDVLEANMVHAWRRQLAALAARLTQEFSHSQDDDPTNSRELPLRRAVGFADLVNFTKLSAELDYPELADFIQRFESVARDIVASHGGRVVKTIGDAVMFVADDAVTGARIALALANSGVIQTPSWQVRVSVVWGRILARFGDVFGPPVNVASRLAEVARPGIVYTNQDTARELARSSEFYLTGQHEIDLAGIGRVQPVVVTRID